MNMLFLYISLIIVGFLTLYTVISNHRRLVRNREFILGVRPKEESEKNIKQGKNKQQVELELLLVNNNKLSEMLGIIDRNVKLKLLIIVFFSGLYYAFNINSENNFIAFLAIFIATIIIPGLMTSFILKRKVKSIMQDLPAFIDLVAVCIQSGMTIDMSLKRISSDFKVLNPDLSYVMLRVIRKSEITSLSSALDDLASSLPTREIKMFTTVLQQSLNFGSSIYQQMIQLSADIRELQLLTIEEKLGTLSAKMSIPLILFIMFPIIILILAPGAMRVLSNVF